VAEKGQLSSDEVDVDDKQATIWRRDDGDDTDDGIDGMNRTNPQASGTLQQNSASGRRPSCLIIILLGYILRGKVKSHITERNNTDTTIKTS
jgi:hypothetical protein